VGDKQNMLRLVEGVIGGTKSNYEVPKLNIDIYLNKLNLHVGHSHSASFYH
jgi:hypothetical protein